MKKLISLTAIITLIVGCVAVPKTSINGTLGGQPFELSSPKDSELVGFELTAETNGSMRLKIDSLAVRMNPDVVSMTGDAQVKIINAVASGVTDAIAQTAAKTATNIAKP